MIGNLNAVKLIAENDGGREFHMAGEGDVLSDNASDSDSSESPGSRAPWGADHPCQDPLRERVPFSSQELELIGREYHRITSTNPRCKSVVKEFCKQSGKMRTWWELFIHATSTTLLGWSKGLIRGGIAKNVRRMAGVAESTATDWTGSVYCTKMYIN